MQFEKMQRACAGVSSADGSITWILILAIAFVKNEGLTVALNEGVLLRLILVRLLVEDFADTVA